MKRILLFTFLLLAASFAFADPSRAFIFISAGGFLKGNRPIARAPYWASRKLSFVVNPNQSVYGGSVTPSLSAADFLAGVQMAINSWASICNADVSVVYAGTGSNLRDPNDGVNSISWDNNTVGGGSQFSSTSTLAFAVSSVGSTTDRYADCDIVVNGNAVGSFGINGESSKFDIVGVLAHEIGHCLGLDHSVESPTYTSNNPILLSATMAATVAAGNLEQRSLSQDEKDGMECVNPAGSDFRTGGRCGSYHGTNGGAALSGTVLGGPSSELSSCGPGGATALAPSKEESRGCISDVFADDGGQKKPSSQSPIWQILLPAALGCWILKRKRRAKFFAFALFSLSLLSEKPARAFEIEAGADHRFSHPSLINKATEFSANEGTFAATKGDTNFNRQWALLGAARMPIIPSLLHGGLGVRYWNEASRGLEGYDSAGVLILSKDTALNGFMFGPTARLAVMPFPYGINLSLDAWLLFGSMSFEQNYTGLGNDTGRLQASATAIEAMTNVVLDCPINGPITLRFRGGYSFYRTGVFGIDSARGSRFSGFGEGKKLQVTDGVRQDLRAVFSGVVLGAFLVLEL